MKIDCPVVCQIQQHLDPKVSLAMDEVQRHQANDESIGIVRMYNWDRRYMVLANRQKDHDINYAALERDNIPVVRRGRGGGALFVGDGDFVMSVAIGRDVFPNVTRGLPVFYMFNNILVKTLQELGVECHRAKEGQHHPFFRTPACFTSLDKGELVDSHGHKIFGGDFTGQTKRGYFQYGFVPLDEDHARVHDYINTELEPVVTPSSLYAYNIKFIDLARGFVKTMYQEYPEWRQ